MKRKPRAVRLFRSGYHQVVRFPREFELPGDETLMTQQGSRLILQPLPKQTLLQTLERLEPIEEAFPDIDNLPIDDIRL